MSTNDSIPVWEAARLMGLAVESVHGLIRDGRLPFTLEPIGPVRTRRVVSRADALAYRCPNAHQERARLARLSPNPEV